MINFLRYRLPLYAAIALIGWLGFQLIYLHIKGIEHSPLQTAYHRKPINRVLKPDPPPRHSEPRVKEVKGFTRQPDKPEAPSNPFTIGSWRVEESLCAGLTINVTTDELGNPSLEYRPIDPGFFEVGKLREVYLYGDRWWEWKEEARQGWRVGFGYHQDLARIGPLVPSIYGEVGWEHETLRGIAIDGFEARAGVRIGVRL